jgi:aarF domain-containing kinase
MAAIQATLAASALRRDSPVARSAKHLRRLDRSLRVALPSAFGRQRCRITCQAGNPWEQAVTQPDTFTRYSGYIAEAALEEADQLDEYNADKIAAVFRRRPFLLARRLTEIARTLGWWAAVRYFDTLFGKKDSNFKACMSSKPPQ